MTDNRFTGKTHRSWHRARLNDPDVTVQFYDSSDHKVWPRQRRHQHAKTGPAVDFHQHRAITANYPNECRTQNHAASHHSRTHPQFHGEKQRQSTFRTTHLLSYFYHSEKRRY